MHGNYTAVTAMQRSRPADRSRRPLRRPGDREDLRRSRRRPRSSTSTSTPPSSARCGGPTCGSSATAGRSSSELLLARWTPVTPVGEAVVQDLDARGWRQIHEWQERFPLTTTGDGGRCAQAAVRRRDSSGTPRRRGHDRRRRRRPAPDVGLAVLALRAPLHLGQLGRAGTMGFAVPGGIGAKVGRPDQTVWAIDGDGCFQMTAQELVTACAERIPVKVAILNNAYLGMVRQWQEMFYEERYSEVYLSPDLPDYVKWAEAMGCVGIRVESPEEVGPAIEKANSIDDRPVVIDFRTDAFEKVYPMVPAGCVERRHRGAPGPGGGPMSARPRRTSRRLKGGKGPSPPPSHPLGPRGEQGRCAGPGGGTVQPARLQHLLARRRADRRGRALQPHHDRGGRGVRAPRADRSCSSTS